MRNSALQFDGDVLVGVGEVEAGDAAVAASHFVLRDRSWQPVLGEEAEEAALEHAGRYFRERSALFEDRSDGGDAIAALRAQLGDAAFERRSLDLAVTLGAVERLLDLRGGRDG